MKWLLIFFLLSATSAYSQHEVLRSARPSRIPGPFTVGRQVAQLQTGMQMGKTPSGATVFSLPAIVRYGLTNRFEVRGGYKGTSIQTPEGFKDINSVVLGIKANLTPLEKPLQLSAMMHYRYNRSRNEQELSEGSGPEVHLIAAHKLKHNLGIVWFVGTGASNGLDISWFRTGPRINYMLSRNIRANLDYHFSKVEGTSDHETRVGLAWWVSNDFALDISGVYGYQDQSRWAIGMGLSWRLATGS